MTWEVSWDGLWTLSFGLSQFHGHGSWLVCEVALKDIDVSISRLESDGDSCSKTFSFQVAHRLNTII